MLYPLLILSIVCFLLIFMYLLTIRRNAVVSDRLMQTTDMMIRKHDFLGLSAFCRRKNQAMARVVQKTLDFLVKNPGSGFGVLSEVAESEGSRQANLLSSRITYLADIGAIAPMLGLLGTVIGMIKSFSQIAEGGVQGVKQMHLAGGVAEALINTALGLAIGIPAFIFYSLFRVRVQKYIAELESATTYFLSILLAQTERTPPASSVFYQQQQAKPAPREDYALQNRYKD